MRRIRPMAFPLLAVLALAIGPATAQDFRQPAPAGAKVYFIAPQDGATLSGPIKVSFGLAGMGVAPAGVDKPATGHHHLLIDTRLGDENAAILNDANNRHFGGGQTEVTLTLAPGKHTLQLVLGDHQHIPFKPLIASEVITITVK